MRTVSEPAGQRGPGGAIRLATPAVWVAGHVGRDRKRPPTPQACSWDADRS